MTDADKQCKWPDCAMATKCSVCGKQLCTVESHKTKKVTGHFAIDDRVVCAECWDKKRENPCAK